MSTNLNKKVAAIVGHRYLTAEEWNIGDHILLAGEMGIESDTRKFKFGDGSTRWKQLRYASVEEIDLNGFLNSEVSNLIDAKINTHINTFMLVQGEKKGLQQNSFKYEGNDYPSAIASGIGASAFGGRRFDKITDTSKLITQAIGNQSFAAGVGVVVNGDWSVGFGKDTKTYQRGAFVVGGGNIVGMTEEQYDAFKSAYNNASSEEKAKWKINKYPQVYSNEYDAEKGWAIYNEIYSFGAAFGESNKVYSRSGFASGARNEIQNCFAAAFGSDNKIYGQYSIALGTQNIVCGQFASAFGAYNITNANGAHAEGNHVLAYGVYSHAEGYGTKMHDTSNITKIPSWNSVSEIIASQRNALIEGSETDPIHLAYGNYSHVEGFDCLSLNTASHAEGRLTLSYGQASHAEGFKTAALGTGSHAEGYSSNIISAIPTSYSSLSTYWNSNKCLIAYGSGSHAEGYNTVAFGNYSHAQGRETVSYGESSFAGGYLTEAKGNYSFAFGARSIAHMDWGVALGENCEANRQCFAMGYACKATPEYNGSTIKKTCSTAIGNKCTTTGANSFAGGYNTTVSGSYAFAYGANLNVDGNYCTAVGKNNDGSFLFSVGGGDSSDKPKDFLRISGNGDIFIYDNLSKNLINLTKIIRNAHSSYINKSGYFAKTYEY